MDHNRPHLFTPLKLHALSWQCKTLCHLSLSVRSHRHSDYMGHFHFSIAIRGDHPDSASWLERLLEPPNAHLPVDGIWLERLSKHLPVILSLSADAPVTLLSSF